MSEKKDKSKRSTTDTARRIWLAGIGAYGRAYTETKEAIKDASGEASEVFDSLVQKGEMLEMAVGMKSKEVIGKAGVPDLHLDDRIKKMRERLKKANVFDRDEPTPVSHDVEARLSAIEAKLDAILDAMGGPKKTAPRKPKPKPKPKAKTKPVKTQKTAPKT